jgi:membrane protein implicated in regulation of membrane protease activity
MRHVITLLLFVGAIAAYFAGSMPGAAVLLAAGAVLETLGWYRLFRGKLQSPTKH